MSIRLAAVLLSMPLLAACKPVDGTFLPGCKAFSGDRIELDGGTFTWDRFTDSISVDADGNVIDPYPEYPVSGRYEIDGQRLTLAFDANSSVVILHIHRRDKNGLVLLTDEQQADWEKSGRYDECVLTRVETSSEED